MTADKGSKPQAEESSLDFESQLDDLLQQIDQAEPGLLSHAAPVAPTPATTPTTPSTHEFAEAEAAESPVASDQPLPVGEVPDISDEEAAEQFSTLDDLTLGELDDQTVAESAEDDISFSPEDFVTKEQVDELDEPLRKQAAMADVSDEQADSDLEEDQAADDQPADPIGLDLASQIQQLLDDSHEDTGSDATALPENQSENQPDKQTRPRAESARIDEASLASEDLSEEDEEAQSESAEEILQEVASVLDASAQARLLEEAEALKQAAAQASEEEAGQAVATTDAPQDASMSLDDIDQLLAKEADEAVAGDFETTHDVISTESKPEVAAQAAEDQTAANEEDFGGLFEAPHEVFSQGPTDDSDPDAAAPGQGLSPGALAVAQELDDQPENRVKPSVDESEPEAASLPDSKQTFREKLAAMVQDRKLPTLVRQSCTTISRPMEAVAPGTRDLVGYIGLITLILGTLTVAIKIIAAMNH